MPPGFFSLSFYSQHVFSKPHHSKFKAHCHPQPISHFATKGSAEHGQTFCQRYWFDPLHYKKGGPVIVLDGGETSGENRLPFLETGIIKRIAEVRACVHEMREGRPWRIFTRPAHRAHRRDFDLRPPLPHLTGDSRSPGHPRAPLLWPVVPVRQGSEPLDGLTPVPQQR